MEDNSRLLIIITAIKKNAVIPDQLIKKLNGTTLIQRAIDTSKQLVRNANILVVTDSEEISLISERNGVAHYKSTTLSLTSENIIETVINIVKDRDQEDLLIYRANATLIGIDILQNAYNAFREDREQVLLSVKKDTSNLLKKEGGVLEKVGGSDYFEELKAFVFLNRKYKNMQKITPFVIESEKSIEIESYQDWWVCEKVLQRKRIVFHVIGSTEIGMGHIYRSLALAHEISDHEVIFVCDSVYEIAVERIAAKDYKVIATPDPLQTIVELKPDMVVNDVLNTQKADVKVLKERGVRVVNFEDLGSGSGYADIVFNELYETPQLEGEHYMWGHRFTTLRDEFDDAQPHEFMENISSILLTFGGTDQNNLTMVTLQSIIEIAKKREIKIYVVCGSGYLFKKELEQYIDKLEYDKIEFTYASGVISKIMEKTQIALSANGRTVYELADMNIPSIVVSHHDREGTHSFASLERGFINLGVYDPKTTPEAITKAFEKLLNDADYRYLLFLNIKKYAFRENKKRVVQKIMELLD